MAGGAKLGELHLEPGQKLWMAKSDIKDYFYYLRLDSDIVEYFAMPAISIALIQQVYQEKGEEVPGEVRRLASLGYKEVYACVCVVSMGFNWAMWIAQRTHTHIIQTSSMLGGERVIEEYQPVPRLDDKGLLLPYVDNLTVLSTSESEANSILERCTKALGASGFKVHEIEPATTSCAILGYWVDGEKGTVEVKPERLAHIVFGWSWLANRQPRVKGKMVEKLLGHTIGALLLFRPLLSCLQHLYGFCRMAKTTPLRFWNSCAKEARILCALLPL
eukprot:6168034-Amphidinium_carterae.1